MKRFLILTLATLSCGTPPEGFKACEVIAPYTCSPSQLDFEGLTYKACADKAEEMGDCGFYYQPETECTSELEKTTRLPMKECISHSLSVCKIIEGTCSNSTLTSK